ncbi:MAG: CAP domain-containing protein [Candidatus Pacebacteria bacterium]|nr:CAP domain-containing protein [Candidatus Paceibacterota bacterium]MDD5356691.1 CAP domain-containing protein [Candidatus Paceibacterota bacterium]
MGNFLKHHFIPHEGNEYKPHFLREASIASLISLALILFLGSISYGIVATKTNILASIYPSLVVNLTNENRTAQGDLPLQVNPLLEKSAGFKAEDMAEKGYFAHTSPEGLTPWHWFDLAGYAYIYAGENLAVNFSDTDTVVNAWMNSPTHRENILNNHFTEIGIATSHGVYKGRDTIFVVQDFGTPSLASAEGNVRPVLKEVKSIAPISQVQVSPEVAGESVKKDFVQAEAPLQTFVAVKNEAAVSSAPAQQAIDGNSFPKLSWYQRAVLLYPKIVSDAYIVLAGIVVLSLVLLIFIEVKKQHPKHILYGFLVLALVLVLLYLSRAILFPQVIII